LPLTAVVAIGVSSTGLTPSVGGADTVATLRAPAATLGRVEQSALLQLYASESELLRARSEQARLGARTSALASREEDVQRSTTIVTRSLAASQARVARLLRYLYLRGVSDPLAVILGAESFDEAVHGIDSLNRATAQNQRLAQSALAQADRLRRLRADLAQRRREMDGARASARAATAGLAVAVAERASTVSAISRDKTVAAQRLAVLREQARAAARASARVVVQQLQVAASAGSEVLSTEDAPVTPAAAPAGGSAIEQRATHTLVVDAVAYHLVGRTASGLPVGTGVMAVDPSVIPLGTRVSVPGYGPAVAADVGSAVKGLVIDLWMPSMTQARAWGRRTVTITVYG
jgi:3D (Asp-Asp-Asp) domain-containing protein